MSEQQGKSGPCRERLLGVAPLWVRPCHPVWGQTVGVAGRADAMDARTVDASADEQQERAGLNQVYLLPKNHRPCGVMEAIGLSRERVRGDKDQLLAERTRDRWPRWESRSRQCRMESNVVAVAARNSHCHGRERIIAWRHAVELDIKPA